MKAWRIALLLLGLEVLLFLAIHRGRTPSATPIANTATTSAGNATAQTTSPTIASQQLNPTAETTLRYQTYSLSQATAHVLTIPAGGEARVQVGVSPGVDSLENFAQSTGAIAVINGGFFDPANLMTTSYVVQEGQLAADPRQNDRLMQNPDLTPYLSQILNRSEFRRYQCGLQNGSEVRYAIAPQNEPSPTDCQLVDAVGAGPQLLPTLTLEQEGFLTQENGTVIRDALGYDRPNARSAVGLTAQGDVVLVMVAKQPDNPASGVSLPALAEFMKSIGVTQALNLDGGGSSSLYYNGKTIFGSIDPEGNPVERSVKSVLVVIPRN
ncbi:phosphodiester glycosidase family protein [Leptolyngbya ohadii]|uniref:phosphodiester glycosidase family protein n=1 Tax=Leptolyngbya ohadii TaxID=1962290 RepID=UPI000B59F8E5|nr:phosphodiester glycosidase family protein [Leptolyngbya ohadii]